MLALLFLCAAISATKIEEAHKSSSSDDSSSSSSSSSSSGCKDCVEAVYPNPDREKFGACCFGDRSLGEDFTEARCPYVWAGAGTDASDCANLTPCCYTKHGGKCTHEHCFSCVMNGGKQVKFCNECKQDTDSSSSSSSDEPPKEHTPPVRHTPETEHVPTTRKPLRPPTGCCCTRDTPPRKTTAEECHKCNGVYRGDGSSCNDEDACQARCCDRRTRRCEHCDKFEDWKEHSFVGFGSETCCEDVCGVTCCINAKAVDADSAKECVAQGGTAIEGVGVEEAQCGGACCVGATFYLTNSTGCTALNGNFLGDGIGFYPGVCGGCGCVDASIAHEGISEADCALDRTCVFQGNDTICNPLKKRALLKRGEKSSSSSSDSDKSSSWFSSDSHTYDNSPALFDLCSNDGCCCVKGREGHVEKKMVRDSLACYQLGGVFQGEGVVCEKCQCKGGVCCDGRAGYFVSKKADCDLKHGHYAGDGTTLDMEGVCDHQGGACHCGSRHEDGRKRDGGKEHEDDDQCLETPDARVCREFGCGNSFRGVGTHCNSDDDDDEGNQPHEGEGSCCLPRRFDQDVHLCEIVSDKTRCVFLGGVWNGKGSTCEDDTCKLLTGRCCVRGKKGESASEAKCHDEFTANDCQQWGGHWGGPDSLCSDEWACDPRHVGACCRTGAACTVTTPKVCHHVGGRFQGFESKCQDLHNGICKVCMPCVVDAPSCSDAKHCENPEAVCVREYGKCMVLAKPIQSDYTDYDISDSSAESSETFERKLGIDSRDKPARRSSSSSSSSSSSEETESGPVTDDESESTEETAESTEEEEEESSTDESESSSSSSGDSLRERRERIDRARASAERRHRRHESSSDSIERRRERIARERASANREHREDESSSDIRSALRREEEKESDRESARRHHLAHESSSDVRSAQRRKEKIAQERKSAQRSVSASDVLSAHAQIVDRKRGAPHKSSSSSSSEHSHTNHTSNFGPLSCGSRHTIGLPCVAKPLLGKCRIGVCMAPPEDSTLTPGCESVCRYIKDFECGCGCENAWLKTCGLITGRVINDKNKNHKFERDSDAMIGGAVVQVWSHTHDGSERRFVSQQTTSKEGHFAFNSLEPGHHEVTVKWPGCFTSRESRRTFNIECLEQSFNALRAASHGITDIGAKHVSAFSARLEERHGGDSTHLTNNVDFFGTEDCDNKNNDEESQHHDKPKKADDDSDARRHSDKSKPKSEARDKRHSGGDDDEHRFDKNGFDNDGFNKRGFDGNGFDKNGFDKDGFDKDGNQRSEKHVSSSSDRKHNSDKESARDKSSSEEKERSDSDGSRRDDGKQRREGEHGNHHDREDGLAWWAILLIVVGSVVFICVIIVLCTIARRRRRRNL